MMKILHRFMLYFTLLSFVSACTTTYKTESETPEVIQAFFIADDTLYAIGQLNSYQFKGVGENYSNRETRKLIQFLQNKMLMQKVVSARVLYIQQEVGDVEIYAKVALKLNAATLSEQEKKTIETDFDEIDRDNEIDFWIAGSLTQIQNREAVLKQASLATPLQTTFRTYSRHLKADPNGGDAVVITLGMVGAGIVMLPLTIITLPLAVIGGLVESAK